MIVLEQHDSFFDYINKILDVKFDASQSRCIASVTEDNKIMGVVVYSRFTPWNCELSIASTTPRFITRPFIRAVFEYPFVHCNLRRITGVIENGNQKAMELNTRIGFKQEAYLKGWYGETDGIMLRMLREECKWI